MQYIKITKPDGRFFYRPYSKKTSALLQRSNNLMNEGHKDKIEIVEATLVAGQYENIVVKEQLHKGSKSMKSILSEKDAEIQRLKEQLESLSTGDFEVKKGRKSKSVTDVIE